MTELPKGWEWSTVGGVSDPPQYGWTTKAANSGQVRLLRTTDITRGPVRWDTVPFCTEMPGNLAKYQLMKGDIVVSRAGSVGASALIVDDPPPPAAFASYLIRLRPSQSLDERFLAFFLHSPLYWTQIADSAAGIALQNVNAKKLAAIALPVAPLAEQQRIVAAIEEAFSKLDAGEAGLRTVRQLLKRMRDAILDAAVIGRLVPQDPTDTPATKLLADLGVEPIEPDGRPNLPVGWEFVALGQLTEVISGPAFRSDRFGGPNEGVRLLRGENIEPGSLRWKDTRTWPPDLLEGYEHLFVEPTDLILAMDRPVISSGLKLARVRPDDSPALLVQRVARIRPRLGGLLPYLWLLMQHRRFIGHLLDGQVGTQLPHITLKAIRSYEVAIPGVEEVTRIVTEVDRQLSFVEACERVVDAGLARSAALRRSVLKAAFEGHLVSQDPTDEPASVLLDRIRAERAAAPKAKPRRARAKQ